MNEKKMYLIWIRLHGKDAVLKARINEAAPKIKAVVDRLSHKECNVAFTSGDGGTFGFFLKTSAPLGVMRAEFYGTSINTTAGSPLLNDDHYFAIEVTDNFDSIGFTQGRTFLQHHHR